MATTTTTTTRKTRTTDPAEAIRKAQAEKGAQIVGEAFAELGGGVIFAKAPAKKAAAKKAAAKTTTAKAPAKRSTPAKASKVVTRPEARDDATTAPVASTDRVERLALAKAEKAALDAWATGGRKGAAPATPNLDAIGAQPQGPKTPRRSTAAKVQVEAPKPGAGQVVVELRNARHADVVKAVSPKGSVVDVVDRWIVLDRSKAQALFDAVVQAHTDATAEFQRRLLMLASLWIRLAAPKVTDDRTSKAPAVVTAALAAKRPVKVLARSDAQPTFEIDGKAFPTASAALASLA